ncbi:MAG TPA: hypothetical protein VMB27_18875 [Solirubrobacteraceae bacterium]|nr:hypothetical protein [Solirubrobacteraceae bacterium]
MGTSDDVMIARREHERTRLAGRWRSSSLIGGGTGGNEQLTALNGAILIVLLAVIGFTIPQLRQFIWMHLFVGLLLIGPVLLKMASTGYRFVRYYTHDSEYQRKGPPELVLRLIAPLVVISTVGVFVTGIALLIVGPTHRDPWLLLHKVTFIVWIVFTSVHILGHLPAVGRALRIGGREQAQGLVAAGGTTGRWIALAGALVGGLVLAVVLIPTFASWTAHSVFLHDHHH